MSVWLLHNSSSPFKAHQIYVDKICHLIHIVACRLLPFPTHFNYKCFVKTQRLLVFYEEMNIELKSLHNYTNVSNLNGKHLGGGRTEEIKILWINCS